LIVHQGIEMHRPSRIEVLLGDNEVRVFGSAIFAAEGRLQLEDSAALRP
jgi:predicted PhzF superfamily epimerase YddE/YHI9